MRQLICMLLFPVLAGWILPAGATHIVGGEVTYQWLGNHTYKITINIYQDCYYGAPEAMAADTPAYISIYDGKSNFRYLWDSIDASSLVMVPPNFKNECIKNPPPTCLRKLTFVKTYDLPKENVNGFRIVYQRCCRNGSIINIETPASVGATFSCIIPPLSTTPGNNSAYFKNYPPQIICINTPLVYDHSATDPDGDSLSYEFCTAYIGGSASDAKPIPTLNAPPVLYISPFAASKPMTGKPVIQIDPVTGVITGTPNMVGCYVVAVACHEWKNHAIINTVTREFQFVVTNCSKTVVADIPQLSSDFNTYMVECNSKTVHFLNRSVGGFSYFWKFGVPGSTTDTSSQFEPTFDFPDTGVYGVTLYVNRGTTCSDSITRLVKIYPTFKADFSIEGLRCPGSPLRFNDKTESTYKPITTWAWDFGDGKGSSNESNPVYTYVSGGNYNVKLITQNIKGCTDTIAKSVDIEKFEASVNVRDTIIVKGESINFQTSGAASFTWTPATYLDNPNIRNPVGYYPDTGKIQYIVHMSSEAGCEGYDTVNVWVVDQSAIFVPSAFSPNGDGLNDILKPIGIGYRNINYFRIFNRWGQQVYYSTRFKMGWDGSSEGGKLADVGVYYWELSVTNRFGSEELIKGDVSLIR